ncbi:MAG: U32 family peptidase, partial [Oscillibacter sp.]|nr:U32 family peptidase [Oscillibacter sp.]
VRAKGFSDAEFQEAVAYCHLRGVRVFLTLNTLLTDGELPKALDQARTASRLGVDAVLVQDWGLFRLLRKTLPDLPVHASTQMSVFTGGGAALLWRDGCERIVLARECSREDFLRIREKCGGELELFAHGALCMCYSGQCTFSAVVGGRSGNRGKCAQPCRLAYGVDGPVRDGYPLSLKDMCMASRVPELAELGVDCLKLEGRLKRAEYVAVVTSVYARLLRENRGPTAAEAEELDLAFSRSGFTDGWWTGKNGPEMFGVRGQQMKRQRDREEELFARARATYEKDDRRTVPVRFSISIHGEEPSVLCASDDDGHRVTASGPVPEPARTRALTERDITARLSKTGGTAFRCSETEVSLDDGLALSASALNALRRDALNALAQIRTTPPVRREEPVPALTIPEKPASKAESKRETDVFQTDARLPSDFYADFPVSAEEPRLTVSVMRVEQAEAVLSALNPARLYLPLELMAELDTMPGNGVKNMERCAVLPRVWRDREEAGLLRMLDHAAALGVTGVLVGNIGHIALVSDWNVGKDRNGGNGCLRLYGDYGLNVMNGWSADYLREKGLSSVCVSFELHMAQIRDMPRILPTEALVYGRLPLMITENPPLGCGKLGGKCRKTRRDRDFAGAGNRENRKNNSNAQLFSLSQPLSQGSLGIADLPHSREKCREKKRDISDAAACLTDRTGARFPVLPAWGGRTEIQNSVPLWLADRTDWKRAGLSFARLRFTLDTGEECRRVCRAYLGGAAPWGPFTRGLYDRGVE